MEGRPVWLTSLSVWHRDELVPTGVWTKRQSTLEAATEVLRDVVLGGVGDASRERLFRMNVTLCLHRGLSEMEEELIGPGCAVHLAGAPVEVLWEHGVHASAAAQPCENPTHIPLPNSWKHGLWIPGDCGKCGPCLARLEIERGVAV